MYAQVPANDFPGLDLRESADESAAIDLLNVDFGPPGAVRVRDGYDNFTSSAAASRYYGLAPLYRTDLSITNLVAVRGSTIEVLNTSGGSVATQSTGSTYTQPSFARFGSPGNEFLYVAVCTAMGSAPTSFWRWNGVSFTAVSPASSSPAVVGIHPTDNRLAFANFNSGYSRVNFSDEGTPETFGANNYVELTPGDGEPIRAMVTWGESLFVFKESKFFVFYGTTVDADGIPEFNYRPIASGQGAVGSRAVAVAPEGVYFCARDGVYLTTGSAPERVSDPVEPIFTGRAQSFFASSGLNQAQVPLVAMKWLDGKLYVAYPSGSGTANDRTLVYDTKTGQWSLWNVPMAAVASFRVSSADEVVFAYASGSNHIGRVNSTYSTDDGTAIVSRYRTGFANLGSDLEKRIVKTRLFGTGSVDVQWSRDFGSLDTAKTATLGTAPAIDQAVVDCNVEKGRLWSWQLGKSSGQWTVFRVQHEVDPLGQPDTLTS